MPKKTMTEEERIASWRRDIIKQLHDTVPFDGWSEQALIAAAEKAEVSEVELLRAFPDGVEEALLVFLSDVDAEIADRLIKHDGWDEMGMTARIKTALLTRFDVAGEHKEMFRQLVAFYSVPWRAPLMMQRMYQTVDDMWYMAGDTATDFNFYTKRGLLAGVYSASLMFWLQQEEPDRAALEGFIDRRLSDVMTIPKLKGQVMAHAEDAKERLKDCSAFMPQNVGEQFSRALANWRLGG